MASTKISPPFTAEQFTATRFHTAEQKAQWANKMAAWVTAGFPRSGWTKFLYQGLSGHMFGHIAHYNGEGFYGVWFEDVHKQLKWLQLALKGGAHGFAGDPAWCWSDVEREFSDWVYHNAMVTKYQNSVARISKRGNGRNLPGSRPSTWRKEGRKDEGV